MPIDEPGLVRGRGERLALTIAVMDGTRQTGSAAADRRARVLVIEDQPAILDLLRDLVTLLGLDVDCAADGATGLARLDGGQYDVVLTDLAMPGMNGWDVVRGIRARAPDLPIIMITGTAGDADRRRARAEGVPLVCKPFRIGALESIIQESLDRRAG